MKKYISKYVQYMSLGLTLCWTGCMVWPDYKSPTVEMPDQWHQQLVAGFTAEGQTAGPWWELFNDPILNDLLAEARRNNPTLEEAYWNILQARLARDIAAGRNYPSVDAMGSYARTRYSDQGMVGGGFATDPFDTYSAGFDASWEIDLFGQMKRGVESAQATYEARLENYRDLRVSLAADVARYYVQLRTFQARIDYAQKNIESQSGMLNLTEARFKSELVPRLDVEQATLNIADSQSELPLLRAAEKTTINRLSVLVGKQPGELYDQLAAVKPIPLPPTEVAIQMPAEMLRQRPDIRRAERQLAAQAAQIGYATADLYPSFTLTGAIGFEARDFSNLTRDGSKRYSFGPSLRWAVFQGGRIRNQIRIEESRTEQLYWQYRTTVLSALEEVENAMTDYARELERNAALQRSVTAAKASVELVTTQYKSGLTNFQNVLILQRTQFLQEDKLAQSEGQVVQHLIRIYKALGGWDKSIDTTAAAAEPTGKITNGITDQESELAK